MDRHPSITAIMQYFEYKHLQDPILREVSHRAGDLAWAMYEDARLDGAELTVGLRKLLEAKDCFVRAAIKKPKVSE